MTTRLLLDTHALIWWWKDDPMLPATSRAAMTDPANDVFVSAATAWEMATKVRKGQLPDMAHALPTFHDDVVRDGFHHLSVTTAHGLRGGAMPGTHKDPFDRMLAAQALLENLTVVTRDRAIASFGCEVLW